MLIDYQSLPDSSKVFIYPSSRKFYKSEIPEIKTKIENFINSWSIDDSHVEAGYQLKYDRFIVIVVDTQKTTITTPAIDTLVNFIFSLQKTYNVELLDKMNVCFKQGEYVQYKDLKEFKKLIKNKSVTAKTVVFDNLINTKAELEENWEVPGSESWHSRMF